ncbi:hypothetical protein D3C87_1657730 [compost metagenome]
MKKFVLLVLGFVITSPAMAFEASMGSIYDVATGVCGGNQLCQVYSGSTLMATASPVLLVVGTVDSLIKISQANLKLIVDSQEDASYFVASNGEVRTANMEVALQVIRIENPQLRASDFEIAKAIIGL